MLKDEIKNIEKQKKPKRRSVNVDLTEEMYQEFSLAANECGCSKSEYVRRLHRFAQSE